MLVARPVRREDFSDFIRLARQAGPGFTSLAVSDDILKSRVTKSVKTFSGPEEITADSLYLLMLEDSDSGKIVGMSAIKAQIGVRDPFFNFRILKIAQKSEVSKRRYDMDVLMLVNEYTGASEVGTLFVAPDMRGTGAGRLISQSRYMLMAAAPQRFSDEVVSELRGHVGGDGRSPFWDAIGSKFFKMNFSEADSFSAEQDNQFILDLMPKYPIYAALLPKEAQAVIGKTHPEGGGAKRYLEGEGFRYTGLIDIFDAGPSMSVPRDDIRTVRHSRTLTLMEGDPSESVHDAVISNDDVNGFRCVMSELSFEGEHAIVSAQTLSALKLSAGNTARIWMKR